MGIRKKITNGLSKVFSKYASEKEVMSVMNEWVNKAALKQSIDNASSALYFLDQAKELPTFANTPDIQELNSKLRKIARIDINSDLSNTLTFSEFKEIIPTLLNAQKVMDDIFKTGSTALEHLESQHKTNTEIPQP